MSRSTGYLTHAPIIRVTSDNREVVCPVWMIRASGKIRHILEAISEEMYVDPIDVMSGNYGGDVTEARQIAYWVLRKTTLMSTSQIARKLGRRDHTSAVRGIANVEERRAANPDYLAITDAVLARSIAA